MDKPRCITQADSHLNTPAQLISDITNNSHNFLAILRYNNFADIEKQIANTLKVDNNKSLAYLDQEVIQYVIDNKQNWQAYIEATNIYGTDTIKKNVLHMVNFFEQKHVDSLSDFFLTAKSKLKERGLMCAKLKKEMPELETFITCESEYFLNYIAQRKATVCLNLSKAILYVGCGLAHHWSKQKLMHMQLDYDDLIQYMYELLCQNDNVSWVHFKLDEGIDHVLVDEAQDTSPMQWDILMALISEFFAGDGVRSAYERRVFVVGDYKQSIYSFQGASPKYFGKVQSELKEKTAYINDDLDIVPMDTSFRTGQRILDFVDELINNSEAKAGILHNTNSIVHKSARTNNYSKVELWPLFSDSKKQEEEEEEKLPAISAFCDAIAEKIQHILTSEYYLDSKGRAAKAEDIFILLRNRKPFMEHIIRSLNNKGIPNSGADNKSLTANIAILDLVALAKFLLQPYDDYNLACCLKSPLFALSEDELMYLSLTKGNSSLFSTLLKSSDDKLVNIGKELSHMLNQLDFISPYQFFCEVLAKKNYEKILANIGSEVKDDIHNFLDFIYHWEQENVTNLELFLRELAADNLFIKQNMNEGQANKVQILTAHGSKGLEAPIVILPDTIYNKKNNNHDRVLFDKYTNKKRSLNIPFWIDNKDNNPEFISKQLEQKKAEELLEYQRLLYVAATRAEDYLIIGACENNKNNRLNDNSWYHYAKHAMSKLTNSKSSIIMANYADYLPEDASEVLVFEDKTTKDSYGINTPDNQNSEQIDKSVNSALFEEITLEKKETIVNDEELELKEVAISPLLANSTKNKFNRGLAIHKVLELITNFSEHQHEEVAKKILSQKIYNLSNEEISQSWQDIKSVIYHEEFAKIFSSAPLREVPIFGEVDGKTISARIDCLLVEENEILVVDYKTNRPPPTKVSSIPKSYIKQLEIYEKLLSQIWQDRQIKTAILWTDIPKLVRIK